MSNHGARPAVTIDAARILAAPPIIVPFRYDKRDTMHHALSIGLGMDPLDSAQLRFVYDPAPGSSPAVFPTLSAVLGWVDVVRDPRFRDPAFGIDGDRSVVGEIGIRALGPLPPAGDGIARTSFAKVIDKGRGRGALLLTRKEITLAGSETPAAVLDSWLFVRGAGGFGGCEQGGPEPVVLPDRLPDATCDLRTPENLALLYRLSLGDHNAVHADPDFAVRAGFPKPILHGIASLSIATHAVLRTMFGYDESRFRGARARMISPVFPGDTLRTEMWRDGSAVLFRTGAVNREVLVMTGGRLDAAPAGETSSI